MNGLGQFRPGMKIIGPGGTLTPEAATYFSRLNQHIQSNVGITGFVPPSMTTAQINGLSNVALGTQITNSDLNKIQFYNGTTWETVTSA